MALNGLYNVDLAALGFEEGPNSYDGKVLRKKNQDINKSSSYSFYQGYRRGESFGDYEIVGTVSGSGGYGSYSGNIISEYVATDGTIGQIIKGIPKGFAVKGTSQQDEFHIDNGGGSGTWASWSGELAIDVDAGAGDDVIYFESSYASWGSTLVNGGAGNDTFYFGMIQYSFVLTGGQGADTYVLNGNSGKNLITDFNFAEDKLVVEKPLNSLNVSFENDSISFYPENRIAITYSGIAITLTDASQNTTTVILNGINSIADAKKIKIVSGNTVSTIGSLSTQGTQLQLPAGLSLSEDRTYLMVNSNYAPNILKAADYGTIIETIQAQYVGKYITIEGNAKGNCIVAGNAGSTLYGYGGNDILTGGAGNDILYGGSGNDTFFYARNGGNDIIADFEAGKDKICYTSGSLTKVQISGSDVFLYNGSGYQKLTGKAVKGQYADIIGINGNSVRHNFGTKAKANTWSYTSGQGYHGSTGTDTLTVSGSTSYNINLGIASLYTSIDNVDASKAAATMTITGTGGANRLLGGSKNDIIKGGGGSDTIYGGAGNDTFYYAQGDGNDTIADFSAGTDKIRYTSGSLSKVQISGSDVLLYNGSGYQKLTGKAVKGQYADIIGTNGSSVRHNFGTNATTNKWNYVSGQGYHGSSKVDTLVVTGGASRKINLGTASLYTSIENVEASAATGIMTLTGTAAANALYGGQKNDVLKAGAGNDTVKGNAGHDKLYGEAGNDVLYGGAGNDTLYGGAGNDTFFYARGDGNDTISDFEKGKDKIRYTSGSLSKVNISGKDVLLYNGSGYQKLTGQAAKGQYADIVGTNGKSVRHNFGKNATANSWEYVAGQGYHGSSKTDTLTITGKKSYTINLSDTSLYTSLDQVNASKSKGELTILGSSRADTIIGGSGDDMLIGGAGNDNLQGGAGDDELYSQSGNNVLYGGAGCDYLKGGTGTDTLRGGTGNDIIKCGKGVDKIQFYKGDGKDSIIGANKNDILYLYNISNIKTQARFTLSGHDLVMSFTNNKNDSITLNNWSTSGMNKFVVGNKTYSLKVSGSKVSVK